MQDKAIGALTLTFLLKQAQLWYFVGQDKIIARMAKLGSTSIRYLSLTHDLCLSKAHGVGPQIVLLP